MASQQGITDEELLRAIRTADYLFVTTVDIADEVGISREAVYYRLMDLVDEGALSTRKAGARSRIFWLDERVQ